MYRTEGHPLGCWVWTGTIATNGYGRASVDGRRQAAHRWVYERHVGPVPDHLDLDHLCRVRACVNPAHLEPVTRAENLRRSAPIGFDNPAAAWRALKTHCPNGHAYTIDNVFWHSRGRGLGRKRVCRACHLERRREAKRLKRLEGAPDA